MFTGIIEEIGTIISIKPWGQGFTFEIACRKVLSDLKVGDSVCVSGVCLTVVSYNDRGFRADVVSETVARSIIAGFRIGDKVNLERPLRPNDRLGGHFVQGHVDGIGKVMAKDERPPGFWLTIEMPSELSRYMVVKGSVAIDGVSLTIADVGHDRVSVAIIPHTASSTTLGERAIGERVNIEVDIIAKYVERLHSAPTLQSNLSLQSLAQMGY